MIIDCHGHVSAPVELWAYKATLLSHRGAHGKGAVNVSDEQIIAAANKKEMAPLGHLDMLRKYGTDMQLISPRPFQMMHSQKPARMSQTVFDRLRPHLRAAYVCRPADPKDRRVEHVLAGWEEYAWKANRLGNFRHTYGAAEVNLDYYATWAGKSLGYRILDLTWPDAKSLVPSPTKAADLDCFPTGAARIPFPAAGGRGG